MKKPITIGSPVEFDTDHGPQRGTVADIKPDVGNGQRIAIVQVRTTLNGAHWQIPLNQLQQAA